ncbi:hypothetical protein AGMMS49921_06540 [Endomicrobiia bacterium]|nr:hypothetical protein AGMMS49921_06540 [Endomicrobiia bacterium]
MKTFNFDEKKAQQAIELLLESFGEDLNREGIQPTPARVAKLYKEALSGNAVDPLKLISAHYTTEDHEEMILVKDVSFYSLCEHHLLPFLGKAHVAYIPQKDKIIGVSKLVRLVEFCKQTSASRKIYKAGCRYRDAVYMASWGYGCC